MGRNYTQENDSHRSERQAPASAAINTASSRSPPLSIERKKKQNVILQRILAGEVNPSPTSFPQLKSEIPLIPLACSPGPPEWRKSAQKWEWRSGQAGVPGQGLWARGVVWAAPPLSTDVLWMSSSGRGPRAGLADRSEREGTGDRSRVSTRPAVLPFLTSHAQRRAGRPRGGPPAPGTRPTPVTGKTAAPLGQLQGHRKPPQDALLAQLPPSRLPGAGVGGPAPGCHVFTFTFPL